MQSIARTVNLAVEGSDVWESLDVRKELHRALTRLPKETASVQWTEPVWDPATKSLRVSCTTTAQDALTDLKDWAIAELTQAARGLFPNRELTVHTLPTSVVLAPRHSEFSWEDNWGWYEVVLMVEGAWIRDEPDAGPYIAEDLLKWQRFRNASFAWNEADAIGTLSVELMARSPAGAEGEAKDALGNLILDAVGTREGYTVSTLKVEWLSTPNGDGAVEPTKG